MRGIGRCTAPGAGSARSAGAAGQRGQSPESAGERCDAFPRNAHRRRTDRRGRPAAELHVPLDERRRRPARHHPRGDHLRMRGSVLRPATRTPGRRGIGDGHLPPQAAPGELPPPDFRLHAALRTTAHGDSGPHGTCHALVGPARGGLPLRDERTAAQAAGGSHGRNAAPDRTDRVSQRRAATAAHLGRQPAAAALCALRVRSRDAGAGRDLRPDLPLRSREGSGTPARTGSRDPAGTGASARAKHGAHPLRRKAAAGDRIHETEKQKRIP